MARPVHVGTVSDPAGQGTEGQLVALDPRITAAISERFRQRGADKLDRQTQRALEMGIEYYAEQYNWPVRHALRVIRAGGFDTAIDEALEELT